MNVVKPAGKARTRLGRDSGNALDLLKQDHEEMKAVFAKLERARSNQTKRRLVAALGKLLDVYMQIEEEFVDPTMRATLDNDSLANANAAEERRAIAKRLLSKLRGLEPTDDDYSAAVTLLAENVFRHVGRIESDVLPVLEMTGPDLSELGQQIAHRKQQLQESSGSEARWYPGADGESAVIRSSAKEPKRN